MKFSNFADIAHYLRGKWNMRKKLEYTLGGVPGSIESVISFLPIVENPVDAERSFLNVLLYKETGVFKAQGQDLELRMHKEYLYYCYPDTWKCSVYFIDDPPALCKLLEEAEKDDVRREIERTLKHFFDFDMTAKSIDIATHLCCADTYRVMVTLREENTFQLQYSVHGPKKDGVIQCLYTRCE